MLENLFNLQIAATNIGIIVLVGLVNLWLVLPLVFLAIVFYKFRRFYLETARDVKRLEATSICFTFYPKFCLSPWKLPIIMLFSISFIYVTWIVL